MDGFIAECKPEDKIDVIKKEQAEGKIVAMTGDGTNDAPAAGAGECGPCHEQRHHRRQRGRQYGGPGFRPHKDSGGRGDR